MAWAARGFLRCRGSIPSRETRGEDRPQFDAALTERICLEPLFDERAKAPATPVATPAASTIVHHKCVAIVRGAKTVPAVSSISYVGDPPPWTIFDDQIARANRYLWDELLTDVVAGQFRSKFCEAGCGALSESNSDV